MFYQCQSTGLLIANGRLSDDKNTGKFTFCSQLGQSTVDYLLCNLSDFDAIVYFDTLSFNEHSDHAPITFYLPLKMITKHIQENDTRGISRKIVYDMSKLDSFKLQLQNNIETLNKTIYESERESIDDTVHSFTRLLHDMAFDSFGKTFKTKSYNNENANSTNEWFDESCKNARRYFNTARNAFNRAASEENRQNFTRTRTRCNKIKKKAKAKYKLNEGQRISKLAKRDSRKFLKKIRKSIKKKVDGADTLTIDDLYTHFKSVFSESHENNNQNNDPNIINPAENNTEYQNAVDDELDVEFTESELRRAVFAQKDNKSPGIDSISSEILKASYDVISPSLLYLYNRMFRHGEYPRSWGDGIIAPIFKKGDVNDAGNYRGITLINILAKIYSQLLLNRLTNWVEKYEKITKHQFGFQKGKSIVDCIFILHSIVSKVLDSGEKLYCVFIDYEKCFDKIDRMFLWQKLISQKVSCKLVNAIKSMYITVKSCVRYNSSYSDFFLV